MNQAIEPWFEEFNAEVLAAYERQQEIENETENAKSKWLAALPFLLLLLPDAANQINSVSERSWSKQVESGALGLSGFVPPPDFKSIDDQIRYFTRQSSELIKDIGSKAARDVEILVQQAHTNKWPVEMLRDELQKKLNSTSARAALIARDQTGKLNANLAMVRQTSAGITDYIWRTQRDQRVRKLHRVREGLRFSWSSPPSDGHPGQPIACRCVPEPSPNK